MSLKQTLQCVGSVFNFTFLENSVPLIKFQTLASHIANIMVYYLPSGHEGIVSWLLSQKECTGSEKDFIGSTPVHDAADEGRVRYVVVATT